MLHEKNEAIRFAPLSLSFFGENAFSQLPIESKNAYTHALWKSLLQKFYTKPTYSYPPVAAFAFPTITSPLGIKKTEDPRAKAGIFLGYPFGQIFSLSYMILLSNHLHFQEYQRCFDRTRFEELLRGKSFALSYSVRILSYLIKRNSRIE